MIRLLIEGFFMGVLMVAYCLFGIRNGAVGLVHLYHQDVQDRCVELGLTTREQIRKRQIYFKISGIAGYVIYILLCVYLLNSARGFFSGFWQIFAILSVANLIDRIGIDWYLKAQGNERIGIAGASTTGMLALVAASYFPDITLTIIAMCPSDFIMEGFYQDGKDGAHERPGDNESSVSWRDEPLPYLPYAYRHPEYWQKIKEESKESGDMIASRKMFDESERLHPVQEAERIKVENIKGKIIFVGAEDDVLWDTCKYIRRMEQRLEEKPHECQYESLLYEHGTHFAFPQSMLEIMMPVIGGLFVGIAFKAGRTHPKECKQARIDIDRRLTDTIRNW